jgi:hypothetical protein
MIGELDYNKLVPPSNPDYPWVGEDWQVLCYYCNQPIELTKPWAGYRQRAIYGWQHVYSVLPGDGTIAVSKHIVGSRWHCDPANLRPLTEIDEPRCHICGTQEAGKHAGVCSAAGKPPFRATPMSQKEDEVGRWRAARVKEIARRKEATS